MDIFLENGSRACLHEVRKTKRGAAIALAAPRFG
jgi:hypothetical protein